MDLDRTQFLVGGFPRTIQTFRRRRKYMLFQNGKPLRLCEWNDWVEFRTKWPEEVKKDGLSLHPVWTLEAA